jgi:type I restriction enzyme M protein
MEVNQLENWLWEAACSIRGPVDAPKYKDYILPLLFYKRLSDVYDDETLRLAKELGSESLARSLAENDRNLIRFYIPNGHTWNDIRRSPTDLGERLTEAMRAIAKENPKLEGVIDIRDFNATVERQRIIDDSTLARLVEILSKYRLGLDDVEPDILGRAYEYLLRKFAEGSGQAAGEFYTPKEVGILMANILDPEESEQVYDPACGSGGLLIKAQLRLRDKRGGKVTLPLQIFGQEISHTTYAIAKMNAFIHDMEADIRLGDTMKAPRFTVDGKLCQFDKVTANPMWNQDGYRDVTENDTYGRFTYGVPPNSTADWGWIQHMYASLKEGGKMATVIDTGAVARGSGTQASNRERDIRKAFVDADLVECVIQLPENLFYNATAPGLILVINKAKEQKGQILLINASKQFAKGRPKNYLTEENITRIYKAYHDWKEVEGLSKVITNEEAARNDYNLSPSRYIDSGEREEYRPLEDAVVQLAEAEEERQEINQELTAMLKKLGFEVCIE